MMRTLVRVALAALAALVTAGSAGSDTLPYSGTLSLRFGGFTAGTQASSGDILAIAVAGHLSTLTFAGGELGPITNSLPVTSNQTINSIVLTGVQNLSGTVTGISGPPPLEARKLGLQGTMKICLVFAACASANVTFPLTPTAVTGIGVGGTQIVPGPIPITMQHAPWTIGQPTMTIHTANSTIAIPTLPGGFAHGPASLTSSTARPGGELQMVTATKAFSNQMGAFPNPDPVGEGCSALAPEFAVSTVLRLRFVGQCNDGRDNDGDGLIDSPEDPGCDDAEDDSERSAALMCDNGLDDDGDGRVDFDPATFANPGDQYTLPSGSGDPGCENPSWSTESPQCQDGINNDPGQDPNPGRIDYDAGYSANGSPNLNGPDPQCVGKPWKNNERKPVGTCGLGAELLLVLPLLMWLGRRRKRVFVQLPAAMSGVFPRGCRSDGTGRKDSLQA